MKISIKLLFCAVLLNGCKKSETGSNSSGISLLGKWYLQGASQNAFPVGGGTGHTITNPGNVFKYLEFYGSGGGKGIMGNDTIAFTYAYRTNSLLINYQGNSADNYSISSLRATNLDLQLDQQMGNTETMTDVSYKKGL